MLGESLLTLAALAGQVVVDAAVSDEWEMAERGYAKLLGRGEARADPAGRAVAGGDTRAARLGDRDGHGDGPCGSRGPVGGTVRGPAGAGPVCRGRAAGPRSADPGRAARGKAVGTEPHGERKRQCEQLRGRSRASRHPRRRSELAHGTGPAGDAAAARDQFAALLPAAERILGPEHPDTLAVQASLAYGPGRRGTPPTPGTSRRAAAGPPSAPRPRAPRHPGRRARPGQLHRAGGGRGRRARPVRRAAAASASGHSARTPPTP